MGEILDAGVVYERQGLGRRVGYGRAPALLVIDFVNGFNDPDVLGGGNIGDAILRARPVLEAARRACVPIAFTRIVYQPNGVDAGAFATKLPSLRQLTERHPLSQVVDALKPRTEEYIVRKTQASAFFGTDLNGWLRWRGVDTVLVTGCTTSGCVRASVVDAASHSFRTIVLRDCVGDRALAPHEANLFDMDQKYADVVPAADVLRWLERPFSDS